MEIFQKNYLGDSKEFEIRIKILIKNIFLKESTAQITKQKIRKYWLCTDQIPNFLVLNGVSFHIFFSKYLQMAWVTLGFPTNMRLLGSSLRSIRIWAFVSSSKTWSIRKASSATRLMWFWRRFYIPLASFFFLIRDSRADMQLRRFERSRTLRVFFSESYLALIFLR